MEGESDKKFMPKSHKKALIALLGVVIVLAAGLFLMNGTSPDETPTNTDQTPTDTNQTPEENSNEPAEETNNQEPAFSGVSPSSIEGEIIDVSITEDKAEPTSPEMTPEDGVRFTNNAGVDVQFAFEREYEDFQLPAGESVVIDLKKINYYDVTPLSDEASFKVQGRVNVQPN